jgi:hypothetical protein
MVKIADVSGLQTPAAASHAGLHRRRSRYEWGGIRLCSAGHGSAEGGADIVPSMV